MEKGLAEIFCIISRLGPKDNDHGAGRGQVLAFVGGGGKTTAIFSIARMAADLGQSVLVTTTTRIYDPRDEAGRRFDGLALVAALGETPGPDANEVMKCLGSAAGRIMVAAVRRDGASGKLVGIDPVWASLLAGSFGLVLVEADGAHGRPIKAPGSHEPAMPADADMVLGFIGLDCLGLPLSGSSVHRPECFSAITGVQERGRITPASCGRLAAHPEGLFKGAPEKATRVIVLNKADLVPDLLASEALKEVLSSGGADSAIVAALGAQGISP